MPSDDADSKQPKKKPGIKGSSSSKKKRNTKWIVFITSFTFFLSITISIVSNLVIEDAAIYISLIVLIAIIAVGILFDVIGIAVATADETPFHSLAARKIHCAKDAVGLIRNAEKVSSFCNDVVGDICGVVSGATGAAIAVFFIQRYSWNEILVTLVTTALIASMTVGGKAMGKTFAMTQSNQIVYVAASIIHGFKSFFHILKRKPKNKASSQQEERK